MFSLNCFIATSNFIPIKWKVWEKWREKFLLRADLATLRQGQVQWKQYNMVEVNDAYKIGRYEKIWYNSLRVVSNIKVFATQNGWQNGWPVEHDSIHRSIMILKWNKKKNNDFNLSSTIHHERYPHSIVQSYKDSYIILTLKCHWQVHRSPLPL